MVLIGRVDGGQVWIISVSYTHLTKLTGTDLQAILTFDNTNGEPIIAKVGLSLVSVQNLSLIHI